MTGISMTRPISKNIGRPMIAPTRAIAHGSARAEARPTMVSTIWSAPPESASSFANIAPSAIRAPTPAAVVPKPVVNESSTALKSSPATMPTVSAPRIRARNGCSFTTVMRTTISAIPASAARISCQPGATGCTRSVPARGRTADRVDISVLLVSVVVLVVRSVVRVLLVVGPVVFVPGLVVAHVETRELLDDRVDALVDVDDDAALVGPERFEGGELGFEQRGRHEVARPAGLASGDHPAGAREVEELEAGDVVAELVA